MLAPNTRWNPLETHVVELHGKSSQLPKFLGLARLGGLEVAYFDDPEHPLPPQIGIFDGELAMLTIPKGLRPYRFDANSDAFVPIGNAVDADYYLPVLLFLRARGMQPTWALPQTHFCKSMHGLNVCGRVGCPITIFYPTNMDLIVFKYEPQTNSKDITFVLPDEDGSGRETWDFSNRYLVPVFVNNQTVLYCEFDENDLKYPHVWRDIRANYSTRTDIIAVDTQLKYADELGVWIASNAELRRHEGSVN